jgi:hypothetical protein
MNTPTLNPSFDGQPPFVSHIVRVVFCRDIHAEPEFAEHHVVRTWDVPPYCPTPPDYTGARHGRMTALAWYRQGRDRPIARAHWLCRCDCGKYELRRPGEWEKRPSPKDNPDRCEFCRRADVTVVALDQGTVKRLRLQGEGA